jgi:hypothetical protein
VLVNVTFGAKSRRLLVGGVSPSSGRHVYLRRPEFTRRRVGDLYKPVIRGEYLETLEWGGGHNLNYAMFIGNKWVKYADWLEVAWPKRRIELIRIESCGFGFDRRVVTLIA